MSTDERIEIFCCYAHEDQSYLLELKKQLASFLRLQLISNIWCDADIGPGMDWEREINKHLNTAQVVLLLVSPDFMASDYCYSKEMVRAIERHERNEARVIPVILRPVYGWQKAPFGKLQALPTGAQPVTIRQNRDEAFRNVAEGIHKAIEELTSSPSIDLNRLPPSPHGPYRPTDKLPKHCSRRVLIILVALSLVIIGVFGVVSWEIQLHQLEPPTGFTVARTTLQSGQIMQRGQALVNADIPLTIQGTYTSEGLGLVWVVLRDNFGNYYLQNPPVQFNGGGTWTATNITPRSGTTSIDFVAVTPDGNGTFQQKVSNGDFGAFTQLPQGSLILSSATIPINTSQIRS